jgi:Bifunctional DNA primase/polymerase, N-terminal/Primase C terminal 1 (PriCT-1)
MATKVVQQAIDKYRNENLSFFPIPTRSKKAAIEWKCYQLRLPNEKEVSDWKTNGTSNLAIVCGAVSGNLVVLDFDSHDKFLDYCALLQDKYNIDLFGFTRVVTTARGNHVYFRLPIALKSAKFPQLDVKSEGGYVMAPPSIHPDGSEYKCSNPDIPIRKIENLKDVGIDVSQDEQQRNSGPLENTIPEGQRNSALASLAGTMRRRGMSQDGIFAALLVENNRCQPPLTETEIKAIVESVSRYQPNNTNGNNTDMYKYNASQQSINESNRNKNATENATETQQEPLSKRVEDWIKTSGGRWFETPELDRDLGISSIADKNNRREIMLRFEERAIIERHAKIAKQFRFINKTLSIINFKTASGAGILPFKWPLQIEEYVNLFPGNLAVIAGATNAGKTALLLNVVYLNHQQFPMPIYYFCSEMGDLELKERLEQFEGMTIEEWNFKAIDRSTDFADVIVPDCLNIVDYLELTDELWAVNTHLTNIVRKLGSGLAIVALQKKEGARWGRGQEFSAEKSKLYLSMDKNRLTIVKGKSWANKKVNPNGLRVEFNISKGCQFEMIQEWERTND